MRTSKAFVFSLDSFVAFVLSVAALYSLLFFATVPSAYYTSLMQANYLAKDTLLTLSTTYIPEDESGICEMYAGGTYLSCILGQLEAGNDAPARIYIGEGTDSDESASALVPTQFGYKIEVVKEDGTGWSNESDWSGGSGVAYYDTRLDTQSENKKSYNKLKAAAHVLFFDYAPGEDATPPYSYITCDGDQTVCDAPISDYDIGSASVEVVRFTVYT